jgi:HAE1 family hydrophobic/amphiphilic exporter-1
MLTLVDATARALQRNLDVRISREVVSAAESREVSARGSYDVQLKADGTAHHHDDPNVTLFSGAPPGEIVPHNTDFSSNISLSRLFKTGATATATASVARDKTNSFFTLFAPAYLTSIGAQVRQPLLRNRSVDSARTELVISALDRDKSQATLQRSVQNVVASVEQAYWTLVSALREVQVRRDAFSLAESQRADTQARIDARTAAALDIAQPTAEIERRRGDLLAAQENALRSERTLKLLMTDDPDDPIWSQTLVPVNPPDVEDRPIDIQRALRDALTHRPELASLGADVSAAEARTRLAKDTLKAQVDVVGGYSMRGLAGTHNPETVSFTGVITPFPDVLGGALGTSYHALFNQTFPDATIGVTVSVPFGNHAAKGDYGTAQAQHRPSQLAQQRPNRRRRARRASAVDTPEAGLRRARGLNAANTQLRAEQERFTAGTSTNFLRSRDRMIPEQAQLTEISALTDHRRAQTSSRARQGCC